MILPSILYGFFLAGVVLLYWLAPNKVARLLVLLVTSLYFYASLQLHYVPLMLVLVGLNFFVGKALGTPLDWRIPNEAWPYAQADWNKKRGQLLTGGIVLNVLLLLAFKYFSPLLETLLPNSPTSVLVDSWLMPLGLSFFAFECIAYLVDVYRGSPASDQLLEFAAYKLFFPKLISGPITRFHSFAGQMKEQPVPPLSQSAEGLWLIASGTVKKLLIADHIGLLVNASAGSLPRAGSGDIWLLAFAYGLQLYLDFSGYVDIARGSAILLGFNLPQNFDFPYFATSIADFWRRWHITLGDWLRNYLYFPLGGSRRGLTRTCINLVVVMLVAGVWHGDRWGFIVWGAIHGLALVIHRLSGALSERSKAIASFWQSIPGLLTAWALTQLTVFFSWIFFRLPNLNDAGLAMRHLFGHSADIQFAQKVYQESFGLNRPQISLLLLGIVSLMGVAYGVQRGLKLQISWPVKVLLLPICFYLAWVLAPSEASPYIYFDF
ncbi:MAG: putative membrane protein involved in D-alanine export [Phormidesmis priestleyi Ana]|uniref:Putative membrane protein involved in D-alanine export n=1 Tax=Phormidesmis priestleyi Ana TaxID=1666911 RepID=A0A0P7ZST9_9CYAN|nr:MAG: putative membrane protein involved in D-alanine export [Phormidesmis priestleyi Ana]